MNPTEPTYTANKPNTLEQDIEELRSWAIYHASPPAQGPLLQSRQVLRVLDELEQVKKEMRGYKFDLYNSRRGKELPD